ncbi:MerR family DNA-binding transcriptional regulator, partial [Desulfovibrio sp. OttesenSCG-928-I05]|nr:MerR family DNA-binding transcriptional regulator [Desulfovibrio sp. OttesenSCG-928-I05]
MKRSPVERKKEKKFSIGQIAELCNISKKQLRYYDENGILVPKFRDPETR